MENIDTAEQLDIDTYIKEPMDIDIDIKELFDIDIDGIELLDIDNEICYGHREEDECFDEKED